MKIHKTSQTTSPPSTGDPNRRTQSNLENKPRETVFSEKVLE